MKKSLWAGVMGIAAATAAAQDPVPVAVPGPLVPAYAPLPAFGYPVQPIGGGFVVPGMPGAPVMYGYPPVGFPAQSFAPPPVMMPVAYQMPMPLPMGTPSEMVIVGSMSGKAATAKGPKREAPPQHFGPQFLDVATFDRTRVLTPTIVRPE